ncbi:MAG: CoA ester lyase [Actinomycetota bacterium]
MTPASPAPRPRRSCHAVPASSPRMIEKARDLDADLVFLDLEDSVAPDAKGAAREAVAEALAAGGFRCPTLAVRVNPVDSPHCHRDVVRVVEAGRGGLDVIILPKVEDASHVTFAGHLLAALEAELGLPKGAIGLEAQIETARGMCEVDRIAAACPGRLEALVFGPGDYAASLGMPQTTIGAQAEGYPGDVWHHALSRMVVAARAHGLQAVDGPFAAVRDAEGLRASAERALALGLDGKWSIHPDQIPVLNAVFGVAPGALAHAVAVRDALARAAAEGRGAAMLDGEMIDEATRKMAEAVVRRARLAGIPVPDPAA